jgi:hypothetical protein
MYLAKYKLFREIREREQGKGYGIQKDGASLGSASRQSPDKAIIVVVLASAVAAVVVVEEVVVVVAEAAMAVEGVEACDGHG